MGRVKRQTTTKGTKLASVNKVILVGNLGRDPEMKSTNNGLQIAKFSLATSEKRNDEEQTEWHNVVAFGNQAEIAGQYLKKGSKVYIEGSLHTSNYEKDGEKRYRTEITCRNFQFLDSKPQEPRQETLRPAEEVEDFTDDIPF